MERRFGVSLDPAHVAACVGTKEFVASAAWFLRLRTPERDTVLAPALAYPTYAMGARLAGCRVVEVPAAGDGALDLSAVADDDAERALCLWVNSPSNPTGALSDLGAAAAWGRARGVPVLSDECYAEFTWEGGRRAWSSTAATACWPCTRCRSVRTWPGCASGSTPVTPSWSSTWPRCASTPGSWCRGRCRPPPWWPGTTTPT